MDDIGRWWAIVFHQGVEKFPMMMMNRSTVAKTKHDQTGDQHQKYY